MERAYSPIRIRGLCLISGNSDGIYGVRAFNGDLSGTFYEISGQPGAGQTQGRKVWFFMGDGEMDAPQFLAPFHWLHVRIWTI